MMDGYSVTEAASVLGVPTERVWELLARGVLAGRPEGETGMRVFLQPRSQSSPATPIAEEPAPSASAPDRGELSPFRELLTEFRNLTERYGQALLALGEARGEVASLRSRVDLLEARIELRLPMSGQAQSSGWGMPPPSAEPIRPVPSADPDAEHEDPEAGRGRRRRQRRATESFAEAIARAEDPSPADLPSPAESGREPGGDGAPTATLVEPTLPREVAPADPMPVADETVAGMGEEEELAVAEDAPAAVDEAPVAADEAEEPVPVSAEPELEAPPVEDAGPAPLMVEAESAPEPEPEPVAAEPDGLPLAGEGEPASFAVERELELQPIEGSEPPEPDEPEQAAAAASDEPLADLDEAAAPVAEVELTEATPVEMDAGLEETGAADTSADAVEEAPEPVAEQARAEEITAEEPVAEQARAEEITAEEPVAEEAPAEEPVAEEAPAEEPVPEKPVAEEPVAEEAQAEEPVAAEAQAEEPVAAEAQAEEITAEEPTAEHGQAEAPAADAEEAAPIDYDGQRYTTTIEEPDWLEAEVEAADAGPAPTPEPQATVPDETPEASVEPAPDERGTGLSAERAATPAPEEQGDEETMLWFGRAPEPSGADEMEVVGPSSGASVEAEAAEQFPGSAELDRALALLRESSASLQPAPRDDEELPPARTGVAEPASAAERGSVPSVQEATRHRPVMPGSPATRAYRRLRRIFPD